ncbi:hypothetical protein Tco_0973999 [Tanacetum coccineum]|uniref:Uncharacterized protein n=1 Tax=Tanacetum coccineum TaxID=301880 RepID=A0ABQ5EAC8_9ASTR
MLYTQSPKTWKKMQSLSGKLAALNRLLARYAILQNTEEHHEGDIWMTFGGNIRDLGSIGEETDKTTTLHQSLLKNYGQCLETASQFLAMQSYLTSDGVRTLMTASERIRLKRNPRRFSGATALETL